MKRKHLTKTFIMILNFEKKLWSPCFIQIYVSVVRVMEYNYCTTSAQRIQGIFPCWNFAKPLSMHPPSRIVDVGWWGLSLPDVSLQAVQETSARNTRWRPNDGTMLVRRRRRRTSIEPTLDLPRVVLGRLPLLPVEKYYVTSCLHLRSNQPEKVILPVKYRVCFSTFMPTTQ